MDDWPDDYGVSAEEFEEMYEGQDFPAYHPGKDHFECDFCSKGVPYKKEPRVAQYLTNRIPHNATPPAKEVNRKRKLTPMGTYCEDCSQRLLLFPCTGYFEVRLYMTITEDMVHQDVEITDVSPPDDGIPWDPSEVSEKITGIDFDLHSQMQPDVMMAPENIVTFYLSIGPEIDIRELVNYDGSINGKELGRARKAFEEMHEKLSKSRSRSESRRNFRDHVRGDDQ